METILLIEDTSDILGNLSEYLEMEGYRVLSAADGISGIKMAGENIPHIIICDVLMAEMDGYGVLKALKESPKTCKIPFIFSTSMSEKIDIAEAYKLGADDYLVKPFEVEVLLKMLRTQLNKANR
jgi:DNA-binding response OmpR family regulator